MIDKKQKRMLTIVSISLSVLFFVSTALAFLVDRKTVTNLLGIGENSAGGSTNSVWIDVTEDKFLVQNLADTKLKTIQIDSSHVRHELTGLKPGSKINKDTTIQIKGLSCYIRVKPVMDITDDNGTIVKAANPATKLDKAAIVAQLARYGGSLLKAEDWLFHDDGYMYYKKAVEKVDDTTPLSIALLKTLTDTNSKEYTLAIPKTWGSDVKPLTIQFTADAIQTDGVTLGDPETYKGVSLWRDSDDETQVATDDLFR